MSATPAPTDTPVPTTWEGIHDIVLRATKGDATTIPAVRKLLERPGYIDLMCGNLAAVAQEKFVDALTGKDLAFREAVLAKLAAMRADLLGASPTGVERLLVERVVGCWLQVQDADLRYATAQKDLSIRQADFHQRRMGAANRRCLAALKALALVRRLAVPALQVNIAKKQVDIVGGDAAGTG